MARCSICNTLMGGGYRDGESRYCSLYCYTQSPLSGFCERCLGETTEVSPGVTLRFNMIGTCFIGAAERCHACHSIVQGKWIQLVVPVYRAGKYRMRYTGPNAYVGRKLRG